MIHDHPELEKPFMPVISIKKKRATEDCLRGPWLTAFSESTYDSLNIIVKSELPRMGAQVNGLHFILHLVGDPSLDYVGGENVALQ